MRSEDCRPPSFSSRSRRPVESAGQAAIALIGGTCHVDGVGQGLHDGLEALAVFAGLGHGIERLLGALDQVLGTVLDIGVEGLVDHLGADADELPALGELIDRAAIFLGVDDGGGARRKPRQIGGAADVADGLRRSRNRF